MIRIGYSNSHEFTGREFDIIRELAQGRKYEEIAADLDITLNTVCLLYTSNHIRIQLGGIDSLLILY